MKVILDRIVLQPNDTTPKTKGGIELPDSFQQKTWKVITHGPGTYNASGKLVPPPVSTGDTVMISNNGQCGVDITVNGEKVKVINSSDIIVIL